MTAAEKLSEDIAGLLYDYHSFDPKFKFTADHAMQWVTQFEKEDQEFVLSEFWHLLNQGIYISEDSARKLLLFYINKARAFYKYKTLGEFFANVNFLRLQADHKSQCDLLNLLDNELTKSFGLGLENCGTSSTKIAIYIDDVICSGYTVYNTLEKWLLMEDISGISNVDKLIRGEILLCVIVFCNHNWNKAIWRLCKRFASDNIKINTHIEVYYEIQNNRSFLNQKLNFAFPINNDDGSMVKYLEGLEAKENLIYAFRKEGTPAKEVFFSSAENRKRFENILFKKGVEILAKSKTLDKNQRPLGMTPNNYKILGTGTLFFTWRNISNTCPVVFWWKHHWYPLFILKNRGLH